jgi:hypothetical protein
MLDVLEKIAVHGGECMIERFVAGYCGDAITAECQVRGTITKHD